MIENVILGILSLQPLTGYDLKKVFMDSTLLYWSGNNNEIYRTLLALHRRGLLTCEVQYQESRPPRKVYTLTEAGKTALTEWVKAGAEEPQLRHSLLSRLAWAGSLQDDELDQLLVEAEDDAKNRLLFCQVQRRAAPYLNPQKARTERERQLWDGIWDYWLNFYGHEVDWLARLRAGLKADQDGKEHTAEV